MYVPLKRDMMCYCSDLPSVELTELTELSLPSPKHDDYGLNKIYSISLYFLMRIDSIWTHHQHQQNLFTKQLGQSDATGFLSYPSPPGPAFSLHHISASSHPNLFILSTNTMFLTIPNRFQQLFQQDSQLHLIQTPHTPIFPISFQFRQLSVRTWSGNSPYGPKAILGLFGHT